LRLKLRRCVPSCALALIMYTQGQVRHGNERLSPAPLVSSPRVKVHEIVPPRRAASEVQRQRRLAAAHAQAIGRRSRSAWSGSRRRTRVARLSFVPASRSRVRLGRGQARCVRSTAVARAQAIHRVRSHQAAARLSAASRGCSTARRAACTLRAPLAAPPGRHAPDE
jgi:hypothetical protein